MEPVNKRCPECGSEILVCMMGHYCGPIVKDGKFHGVPAEPDKWHYFDEESVDLQRQLNDFRNDVVRHLEMMAAAYLKATDIPIDECQLVIEQRFTGMVYRFERRKEEE